MTVEHNNRTWNGSRSSDVKVHKAWLPKLRRVLEVSERPTFAVGEWFIRFVIYHHSGQHHYLKLCSQCVGSETCWWVELWWQGRCGGDRFMGSSRGEEWDATWLPRARLYNGWSDCKSNKVCNLGLWVSILFRDNHFDHSRYTDELQFLTTSLSPFMAE